MTCEEKPTESPASGPVSIKKKLLNYRVTRELFDLANLFLAGELKRFAATLFFQALGIWLVIVLIDFGFDYLISEPKCVSSCFDLEGHKCCIASPWFAVRIGVFLAAIFASSFFCTKKTKKGKYKASATLGSLLIITIILAHFSFSVPTTIVCYLLIAIFFVMFFGYRAAL